MLPDVQLWYGFISILTCLYFKLKNTYVFQPDLQISLIIDKVNYNHKDLKEKISFLLKIIFQNHFQLQNQDKFAIIRFVNLELNKSIFQLGMQQRNMEDFLNQVSDHYIQERVQKLRELILVQRKQITIKMHSYKRQLIDMSSSKIQKKQQNQCIESINNVRNPIRRKSSQYRQNFIKEKQLLQDQSQPKDIDLKQSQNCFLLFQKACENILSIYFPILMEDEFLSLQSQEQIHQKISYLNNVVEKTAVNLIKRLTKPGYLLHQMKKQESQNDNAEKQQNSVEISFSNENKKKKTKKKKKQILKKKRGKNTKIPNQSTFVLQKWLLQNFHDPYPTQLKKQQMTQESGLTVHQVNNWFINARQRVIKKFLKKDNSCNLNNSNKVWEEMQQAEGYRKQKGCSNKQQIKSQIS